MPNDSSSPLSSDMQDGHGSEAPNRMPIDSAERALFKWRAIIAPSLRVGAAFLVALSLLHALLLAVCSVPPIADEVRKAWIPIFSPWFAILACLRGRLKLLKWRRDWFMGAMLTWAALIIPSIIAQDYVDAVVGRLTHITRISDIGPHPPTRFLSVSRWAADTGRAVQSVETWISGKHSDRFNISVRYAVPLFDDATAHRTPPAAWLTVNYEHSIDNRSDVRTKEQAVTAHCVDAARKLAAEDFHWVTFFSVEGNTDTRRALEAELKANKATNAPLLCAQNMPFERRTGRTLWWFFVWAAIGTAVWSTVVLAMKLDSERVREWLNGTRRSGSSNAVFANFVPKQGFITTPILLGLNVVVWLAMAVNNLGLDRTSPKELIAWGGAFDPLIGQGELWRLFTSLFVHANLLHVANNLFALALLGMAIESAIRSSWFAGVYLLSGIAATTISTLWHSNTVVVGASGAIFGVAGFGIVQLLTKRGDFGSERVALLKFAAAYLGINLVIGALLPGVDLVAHIAGFAAGALAGAFQCMLPARTASPLAGPRRR